MVGLYRQAYQFQWEASRWIAHGIVRNMLLAIGLFAGAAIVELLLWTLPASRVRKVAAVAVAVAVVITSILSIRAQPGVASILLAVISAYRVCNLARVVRARMHEQYLRRLAFQASAWVIGVQAALFLLWEAGIRLGGKPHHVFLALAYIALGVAVVLFLSTVRHLRTTRPPRISSGIADRDLPSLTVAVPARNETDDLEACLQSLIASDYPKMEILVLDDCSQNKRTPEIIRGFAHDGVRFIQGVPPDENWLAKTYAYQRLYEEANGEFILFCGVDARFAPESLRRLVLSLIQKQKTMLSVIPKNNVPPLFSERSSSLIQPMRYAWELALPRRLFRRPPVLSTCWLIRRDVIRSAGGFAAVSRSIVPESYFARVSAVHDGYTFIQSDERIGITSNKPFAEQQATAIRTRYPQVHRRLELVLLFTVAELCCLAGPYAFAIAALTGHGPRLLLPASLAAIILLTATYSLVVALTYRMPLTRSLVLLPVATVFDVFLLNYSMLMYEFSQIEWKGRNICIPVMRVVDQSALTGAATSSPQHAEA